ncbi:uncharacterized protein BDCG_17199 [Blastomyces dermatitidis ER-3]|uniref:Uncharacterized protein n=3 Tax=Blastomyces TaxID=229219 RepID=A0A179UVV0_BLAGS|nr:uncharacterized protein BDBG_17468 [Blastomyces gilchristii SLH14081]XP_045281404.1 uncharacterized protein BDCG_17199 [Blastomyces dermatitidis ER-3]KMW67503.1 hypothetical protein BDDG_12157 [Blastomyces dermatitidis ATCC 18188]OAT01677.1 hypothetical protein BDCG_17199 [Blastomyces dermatitidis ER-3]OAT11217.1 hypothetical protein BDBG_17468 [Blastomyces gilchristii SLH14081]
MRASHDALLSATVSLGTKGIATNGPEKRKGFELPGTNQLADFKRPDYVHAYAKLNEVQQ